MAQRKKQGPFQHPAKEQAHHKNKGGFLPHTICRNELKIGLETKMKELTRSNS